MNAAAGFTGVVVISTRMKAWGPQDEKINIPPMNSNSKKGHAHADCMDCHSRYRSVFCELTPEELEEVNSYKRSTVYKKGQVIFKQGFYPHGLYCINTGKTKLYQMAENGREQIVRMAKHGDVIGYRALLSGEKYTSSAETIEESSVCFIPRDLFFKFIEKNTSISFQLMKLLSSDLKNAEHKITDLAQKPVRERMAEAILYMKEIYGLEPDNATLSVVLTREEMSNIAGTATETAIRILSDFKQEGLVEFVGKRIKVADMKKLLQAANVND